MVECFGYNLSDRKMMGLVSKETVISCWGVGSGAASRAGFSWWCGET